MGIARTFSGLQQHTFGTYSNGGGCERLTPKAWSLETAIQRWCPRVANPLRRASPYQFERIRFVSVRPAAGRTGRRLFQVTKGAEAH